MKQQHTDRAAEGTDGRFASFSEFEGYLGQLGMFRMTPGLERMEAMLARLGLTRPPFFTVQVVGTNGKGSTSTMLAELAQRHGLKTGLCTSPHFLSVRERVRVDGRMRSEAAWTALANTLMDKGGGELSYFEFITSLAVLAFAEAGVAFAVLETGLGGAFDATTAIEADLVVFTPIGLDHQAVLGPTVAHIAADKARTIRAGRPAVSAPQTAQAAAALREVATERAAPICFLGKTPPGAGPAAREMLLQGAAPLLAGAHQADNARLALAVWRAAGELLPQPARHTVERSVRTHGRSALEAEAIRSAWLPGRLQRLRPVPAEEDAFPCVLGWPPMLLDGAHNAHGLAALGLSLAREGIAPGAVIFSCLADKDLHEMLPLLRALAAGPVFVPPVRDNPRAADPTDLARRIGLNAVPTGTLEEALRAASAHMAERLSETFTQREACRNPLLLCGSLYLLAEFFALRPECLEPGSW